MEMAQDEAGGQELKRLLSALQPVKRQALCPPSSGLNSAAQWEEVAGWKI